MPSSISRRGFLARLSAAAATGCLAGCATVVAEDAAAIDTHTHFYDPSRPEGVPWPSPSDPVLFRTVLPGEYRALAEPLGIGGTVVVEASPRLEDNDWVLDLATRERFIIGFVGHLKPGLPGFREHLRRLSSRAAFRGIRVTLWNPAVAPDDPQFLRDLADLAERNLAVDVLGGTAELGTVVEWSRRIPDLRIVVDHCANVRIDGRAPSAEWLEGIRQCSAHPNIIMKISGLVEGTRAAGGMAPTATDFYAPVLDAIWEAFGEDRVMFGSNWPVCERYGSLATVHGIVAKYASARGPLVERKFFRDNATRIYRLEKRRQRV